jgi:benzoyl-CoA reductase/2-hydroxyglutaryl-CoA dehydratase subunit BcrC/BadD/HgdB
MPTSDSSMTRVLDDWRDRNLDDRLLLARDVVEDADFPTVRRWREAGGKVLGHFQVYFPEEIAHAAGLLPVKIHGAPIEARQAEARFGSYLCSILKTSARAGAQRPARAGHVRQPSDLRRRAQPGRCRIRRAGAQAAIITAAKMCEPGLDEQVAYAAALDRAGIPYFVSEFEEGMTSFEHLQIQLETFVENILFA